MSSTTHDVVLQLIDSALAQRGAQTIETTHVPLIPGGLDRSGDVCPQCQEANTVMQAYYRACDGQDNSMVEGCAECVLRVVVRDSDWDYAVQFETEVPPGS